MRLRANITIKMVKKEYRHFPPHEGGIVLYKTKHPFECFVYILLKLNYRDRFELFFAVFFTLFFVDFLEDFFTAFFIFFAM